MNASSRAATVDELLGMAWFNGLSERERAAWLDRAWKRATPAGHYTLESMPSAADAWEQFKSTRAAY